MKRYYFIMCISALASMICLALPFSGASQQQGEQSLPNKSGVLEADVLQQDSKTESAVLSNPEVEPAAMSTMSVSDETDGQVASASGAIVIPSLYTGVANVSVPLYTVQLGNISLPIGLNYITSGIKVRDIETWVGLGWNFSAGGEITRVVRGEVDRYVRHQMTKTPDGYHTDIVGDEPDIYYYNLGGGTGMFVLDSVGKAFLIPHSGLKITFDITTGPGDYITTEPHFTIVDEQGRAYYYNSREYMQNSGDDKYPSKWMLSSLSDLADNKIYLEYYPADNYSFQNYSYHGELKLTKSKYGIDKNSDKNTGNITSVYPAYLKSITWRTGQIVFKNSKCAGSGTNMNKLDRIEISSTDKLIKTYTFEYSNFSPSNHLKLDRIYLSDGVSKILVNSFGYTGENFFPSRSSKDFDHWGYYNKAGNATSLPSINIPIGYYYTGANKTPNNNASTGLLYKITNSFGGHTELSYELNYAEYSDQGGLRVKEIKEVSSGRSSSRKYEYLKYPNNVSSGILYAKPLYLPIFTNSDDNTFYYDCHDRPDNQIFYLNGTPVCYSIVKEIYPNDSYSVYKFTDNFDYPDIDNTVIYNYTSDANTPNRPEISKTSMEFKRGLPKEVCHYDSNGKLVGKIISDYRFDEGKKNIIYSNVKCSGVNLTLSPNESKSAPYSGTATYYWYSMPVYLKETTTYATDITMKSTIGYEYNTDKMVMTEQKTTDSKGNIYRTKLKYNFDYKFTEPPYDSAALALASMSNHNISVPVEIINYKNNNVVGGKFNFYSAGKFPYLSRSAALAINQPVAPASFKESSYSGTGFICDNRYKTTSITDKYDNYGNLVVASDAAGNHISTIYGYSSTLPVAQVMGSRGYPSGQTVAGTNEIYHTSFETADTYKGVDVANAKSGSKVLNTSVNLTLSNFKPGEYILKYWQSGDAGQTWVPVTTTITISGNPYYLSLTGSASKYIDEVRVMPKGARMTTRTFIPGVGKTSESDVNGVTTYYEYDGFGRLSKILDNERNIIMAKEYNIIDF